MGKGKEPIMKLGEKTRKDLLGLARKHGIKLSKAARANKPALVAAVQAGLPKPAGKKTGKKAGQIVRSKEGLGVMATWERLFLQNEAAFASGKKRGVLTDEQISAAMNAAFPGRDSAIFADVRRVRARYNRDNWSASTTRGETICFRYVRNGKGRIARADSRGKTL